MSADSWTCWLVERGMRGCMEQFMQAACVDVQRQLRWPMHQCKCAGKGLKIFPAGTMALCALCDLR
jgi:hypothetical protein